MSSNPGSTPPTAPTLTVTRSGSTDTITYSAGVAGSNPVASLTMYRINADGSRTMMAGSSWSGTAGSEGTQPAPAAGQSWSYVLVVQDSAGLTAESNHVAVGPVVLTGSPTIGPITVTSANGTDTISYPAPVAGSYPLLGLALFNTVASGSTFLKGSTTSLGAGTLTSPTPGGNDSSTYVIRVFDNTCNADFSTPPTPGHTADSNAVFVAAPTTTDNIVLEAVGAKLVVTHGYSYDGVAHAVGVVLLEGSAAGAEGATPVQTDVNTNPGLFVLDPPPPGQTRYYTVVPYDDQTPPMRGTPSNEVSYTTPIPTLAYDVVARMAAEPGHPALLPDPSVPDAGCAAPIAGTVSSAALLAAAQVVVAPGSTSVGVAIDATALLAGYAVSSVAATATLTRPFATPTTAPGLVTAGPTVVPVAAVGSTPAKTLVQLALCDGTQQAGDVYDVHVVVALADSPTTAHVLVFSVYVEAD